MMAPDLAAADLRQFRDFVSGQQHTLFGSAAHPEAALLFARPSSPTVIPEGILLGGRNDANWFHWLIEYLPRLIQAAGQIDESVPVLISEKVPASGVEALRSLTSRPIVVLEAARAQARCAFRCEACQKKIVYCV